MKNAIFVFALMSFISFISCNSEKKETLTTKEIAKVVENTNSKGYELMKTNCFICHMEVPDHSKHDQMIAPPMMRVQDHYKPSYPNKEAFVTAIKTWVNNPTEDKIMMPGAARKFNIMPKLAIADADLQVIAETLYSMDFATTPKMHKHGTKLSLNDGKKWQLNKNSKKLVATINKQLIDFESDDVKAYNQLGKEVFDNAKTILLDKSYKDVMFKQLQKFFHNVEDNMHTMIAAKTIDEAKTEQQVLIKKFKKFSIFFE